MNNALATKRAGIKENLFSLRTLLGLIVSGVVIYIFIKSFNFSAAIDALSHARLSFIALAIMAQYITLPLRGFLWGTLLMTTGVAINYISLSHYYFLSWFANAILPARIGDVYRAYLLKNNNDISVSLSLGVIFSERVLDLAVTAVLVVLSGSYYWAALKGTPTASYLGWAMAAVLALIVIFLLMVVFSKRLVTFLPVSWRGNAESFSTGIFKWPKLLPVITVMTLTIWLSEALRLYFVFQAFDIKAGFLTAVFISQASLILMSIPLSPAGLGLVELLMLALLSSTGVTSSLAGAITIADRLISYWSLIAFGALVYIFSPRTR